MNDEVLESALSYLSTGPIPLFWAVENAAAFPSAWAHTRDAGLLLRIAAYIVPRTDLVLAACAVARTALPIAWRSGELRDDREYAPVLLAAIQTAAG